MVKNTTGGGRTKGLARKHLNAGGGGGGHTRVPEVDGEEIGIVNKMYGNGMCEVFNNDNIKLVGHIRNKFRGRQKRHNKIEPGQIVLIGLREWESTKKNCDILTVYDESDVSQLKTKPSIKMDNVLRIQQENTLMSAEPIDAFDFTEDDHESDLDEDGGESKVKKVSSEKSEFDVHTGEEIDLEDI